MRPVQASSKTSPSPPCGDWLVAPWRTHTHAGRLTIQIPDALAVHINPEVNPTPVLVILLSLGSGHFNGQGSRDDCCPPIALDLLPCPSQHSALCCGLLLATRPQLTSGSQQQVLFTKHAGGGQGGGHVPCVLVVVVFDVCLCTPDCSEAPVLSPSISSCPPPRPLSPTHNPTTTTHTHTGAGLLRRVARPLLLFAPQSFHEAKPGHCLCRFLLLLLLSCSRPCLPPDQPRQSGPQAPYAAPTKGLV